MPRVDSDVVVIGGGVIGLMTAWRLAQAGRSVALFERDSLMSGASLGSAGMLGPVVDVPQHGPDEFVRFRLESSRRWEVCAAELEDALGGPVGHTRTGGLVLADTGEAAANLRKIAVVHRELGVSSELVSAATVRELEPELDWNGPLALWAPDSRRIDLEVLGRSLRTAIALAGGEVNERCSVQRLVIKDGRVRGVLGEAGWMSRADTVILASGASAQIPDGVPFDEIPLPTPTKGQSLILRSPEAGRLSRIVRGVVVMVPREDDKCLVAGTKEDTGFDRRSTVWAVQKLLRGAQQLVPALGDAEVERCCAGLRPVMPDGLPVVGQSSLPGLWWALGHSFFGVTLAALTADLLAGLIDGQPGWDRWSEYVGPRRFARIGATPRSHAELYSGGWAQRAS